MQRRCGSPKLDSQSIRVISNQVNKHVASRQKEQIVLVISGSFPSAFRKCWEKNDDKNGSGSTFAHPFFFPTAATTALKA